MAIDEARHDELAIRQPNLAQILGPDRVAGHPFLVVMANSYYLDAKYFYDSVLLWGS